MIVDILERLFYTSFYEEWAGNFFSCNFYVCKLLRFTFQVSKQNASTHGHGNSYEDVINQII